MVVSALAGDAGLEGADVLALGEAVDAAVVVVLAGEASLQHWSITSVTLPLMMAAQAASVVGICQTLAPQLAVLVALTEVVVVDILVVDMNVVKVLV